MSFEFELFAQCNSNIPFESRHTRLQGSYTAEIDKIIIMSIDVYVLVNSVEFQYCDANINYQYSIFQFCDVSTF